MIDINATMTLDGVYLDIFKQALQGYCQNGQDPEMATEKALNVVKAVIQKALNESDNTLSIDVFTGLQKIEHISGKKIPETKLYHVNKALREGITPENIISNNPELFEPK